MKFLCLGFFFLNLLNESGDIYFCYHILQFPFYILLEKRKKKSEVKQGNGFDVL